MSQEIQPSLFRSIASFHVSIGNRKFRLFAHPSQFLNLGVILAGYKGLPRRNEKHMRIICSWCRGEGQIGLVGEKAPMEDRRETHGICTVHRLSVQSRWRDTVREAETIGRQLVSVGVMSELSLSDGGRHATFSASHLWIGLKDLARKARS